MPAPSQLKAVLFDLDDTLIDRRSAYNAFYRAFYDRYEAISDELSWPDAKEFFWSMSQDNATDPRQAFEAIKRRWPAVNGDPESHYQDYFAGIVANVRPLPGALDLMGALNSNGVPWGVVTNGGQYQLDKVRSTGMNDLVPFVIATELHGASKPDPEPYMHALRLLELEEPDAGDVLFVGDNPYTDIAGAHGVGMQTAWVRMGREYPSNAPRPNVVIDGVQELHEVLEL